MRHYYATGNGGNGTSIYAFTSKKDRDDFVAWDEFYDQRSAIKRVDARKDKSAFLVQDGEVVIDTDGYSQKMINF